MNIVILTRNRYFDQITFACIPEDLKKHLIFFMLEEEVEAFKMINDIGDATIVPLRGTTCAPEVRECIYKYMGDKLYWVIDDDIVFTRRDYVNGKWIRNTSETHQEAFNIIYHDIVHSLKTEDISFGGVVPSVTIPSDKLVSYNNRITSNSFYNGAKLPKDLQWTRCIATEDIDTTLQLLSQGHRNKLFFKYVAHPAENNTNGGCFEYRTLEMHNESQRKLKELWPDFVKLREVISTSKLWKGQMKLSVTAQFAKAYKSSQIRLKIKLHEPKVNQPKQGELF